MGLNFGILFTTLFMVLIMEMGDKTQLLVMCLTSRYRPMQVFWGITLATAILNILAVLLGAAIGGIQIIQDSVRIGASFLFIFFGLLSLKEEETGEEKCDTPQKGVILAVALAFFLAEFGDKTQLSTFSFAALYPEDPLSVFLGSTLGLIAADCVGLIAGALVIKYVPKRIISILSAILFIIFGLASGWVTLTEHFLLDFGISLIITGTAAVISILLFFLILLLQMRRKSVFHAKKKPKI
ncbi:MAG: TMEM165/GDT1 family protein [Clostridiaceae bacterium]|nr:TMEM165/GDT1 family protein [Clostridiaceae bacterium]